MECVFFLFPGGVCFCFSAHWDPNRQKTYRAKSFVCFGTFRRDTEFRSRVSILFLVFFEEVGSMSAGKMEVRALGTRGGFGDIRRLAGARPPRFLSVLAFEHIEFAFGEANHPRDTHSRGEPDCWPHN